MIKFLIYCYFLKNKYYSTSKDYLLNFLYISRFQKKETDLGGEGKLKLEK